MDKASKQYTAFSLGNLGFFECKHMPFGLCNAPTTFQRLMQKCLGELNLTYCLIYLDGAIVFSKREEAYLKCLHVVFDCSQEHNLKLNPTKCKFFQDEINFLAHHVSKKGMWTSKDNLKAVAEFAHPRFTWKSKPSWAWWGIIGDSSRGLHVLCNFYMSIYLGNVPIRRASEWHSWQRARMPLRLLRRLVMRVLCWLLLTLTSHFS